MLAHHRTHRRKDAALVYADVGEAAPHVGFALRRVDGEVDGGGRAWEAGERDGG